MPNEMYKYDDCRTHISKDQYLIAINRLRKDFEIALKTQQGCVPENASQPFIDLEASIKADERIAFTTDEFDRLGDAVEKVLSQYPGLERRKNKKPDNHNNRQFRRRYKTVFKEGNKYCARPEECSDGAELNKEISDIVSE